MSLPRYEKYEESGVEWLGHVPRDWEVTRIKNLMTEVDERVEEQLQELLGLSKLLGVVRRSELEQGASESDDYAKYKVANAGQLVMNKMQAWNGVFGLSPMMGMVSPDYAVFKFRDPSLAKFLCTLFRTEQMAGVFFTRCRGMGTAFLRLNTGDLFDIKVPIPPPAEVTQINEFLERELAKIDAMVEEQRRLIELLKEKRQAVISHAVTKGLNPDATMKVSGNKWLGQVPSHWKLKRIKHLVSAVVDCLHTTPTYEGDLQYPAIRTADIEPGRVLLEQARLVSKDIYLERIQRLEPGAGDILYSREGERFGIAALVPEGVELCLGQRMMMFRTVAPNSPAYLMWVLNSSSVYQQVLERSAGPTAPHVNIGEIINFLVPAPSPEEQRSIAEHIGYETAKFDKLTAEANYAITLLLEHRSTLISAAVTGKIDVRGPMKEVAA